MEPLKLLPTDRDLLRSILDADTGDYEADWEYYSHNDAGGTDSYFAAAIRRYDDWLREHPLNGEQNSLGPGQARLRHGKQQW